MKDPIYPCLWFDGQAHEAADYYCTIFQESKLVSRSQMVSIIEIRKNRYMLLNAGPEFTFNEAISFVIPCDNQEEVDYYWDHITRDGEEGKCGWCTDKFGVSWQVVPKVLSELMRDPEKAPKAMYAFMQMKKLIISDLIEATS